MIKKVFIFCFITGSVFGQSKNVGAIDYTMVLNFNQKVVNQSVLLVNDKESYFFWNLKLIFIK